MTHRLVVVAFLDHEQIAIGELGFRPAVELNEAEVAEFSTVLRGLPVDGSPHALQFWLLSGDGAYDEGVPGTSSVTHHVPWPLARVRWQ